MPRRLTVTALAIFSPPHKAQIVSGESQGRHLDTGVGLLANMIDGPQGPTPLHLGPTKTSAKDLARSRSVRIGVIRFEIFFFFFDNTKSAKARTPNIENAH